MNFKIENITKKEFPIIDSGFDETGLSWVSIQTKEGIFTGTARVHPDDLEKEWYTKLGGQMIAHHRAYIEYFKYRKRLDINTYTELKRLYCTNKKNTPLSDAIYLKMKELDFNIEQYRQNIILFEMRIQQKIDGLEEYYQAKNK